jgi:hypothetical protein
MEEQNELTVEVQDIPEPEVVTQPYRFFAVEVIRALLTLIFALFLLIVIVWGFVNARGGQEIWTATKELLQLLLPAITALLGSAVGFYFGTQKVQ